MGWRDLSVSTKWGIIYTLINILYTVFVWVGSAIFGASARLDLFFLIFAHWPTFFIGFILTLHSVVLAVALIILSVASIFAIGKLAGYLWYKHWSLKIIAVLLLLLPFSLLGFLPSALRGLNNMP